MDASKLRPKTVAGRFALVAMLAVVAMALSGAAIAALAGPTLGSAAASVAGLDPAVEKSEAISAVKLSQASMVSTPAVALKGPVVVQAHAMPASAMVQTPVEALKTPAALMHAQPAR